MLADIVFLFFQFYFKDTQLFRKIVTVKEELDGTGTGDIGNLENLIRIVFIHENVRTLKYL